MNGKLQTDLAKANRRAPLDRTCTEGPREGRPPLRVLDARTVSAIEAAGELLNRHATKAAWQLALQPPARLELARSRGLGSKYHSPQLECS